MKINNIYKILFFFLAVFIYSNACFNKVISYAATPAIDQVVNVSATSLSEQSIKLTWSKANGAKKYKVYRATSKTGTYQYIGITQTTTFVDDNLQSDTKYYYRVRGYKKIDTIKYNGKYSSKVSASTKKNTTSQTTSDSNFAEQVLVLVNKERVNEGLSELTMSSALLRPANKRALEITSTFSHTRPNGTSWLTVLAEYNVNYKTSGENIAYGYNTPEKLVTGWMNSPGHRANIMNSSFGKIGVGIYTDSTGTVYATQLFSD